jgi:RNA polymerase sigma factor (sigma-70 family)
MLIDMSETDMQLLAGYIRHRAEDDFAELVRRHLGLVYSAAVRQVRLPQLAEEVTQSTFIKLARQAHGLAPDTILTAWLYQVARRKAIDVVRREASRQLREQIATEMNAMNATASDWTHIEPLLDEAMHALDETDRTAVLLRYFENKSLREVGVTLGTSENAAQKRLGRAVERLREFFVKRGVTISTSGLVVVVVANAVQAAPVELAMTISKAVALAGTTMGTTAVTATTKALAMTTFQKVLASATIAAVLATGIYEGWQAVQLGRKNKSLQQQQARVKGILEQLQQERDQTASQLASIQKSAEQSARGATELEGLRREVARLRNATRELAAMKAAALEMEKDPALIAARKLTKKIQQVEEWMRKTPGQEIPELMFVSEGDWIDVVKEYQFDDPPGEDELRDARNRICHTAREMFAGRFSMALTEYVNRNGGKLPTDISEVTDTIPSPMREAIPQRYKLLRSGNVSDLKPKEALVQEIPPELGADGKFADQGDFGYLAIGLSHHYDWIMPDGKEKVFAK